VRAALWYSYGRRNRRTLERLLRRFVTVQSEYAVDGVFQGDYYEGLAKLRLALAARAGPSMSHVIAEVVPYLAGAAVLEPLGGYPGAGDLDLISPLGQEATWVRGSSRPLVALPFNRSTPIAYLDGEVIERHRLRPPSSWEELRETARALTVRRRSRTVRHGFECPISWWFWTARVYQGGGRIIEADGTPSLGGDAGVKALELWQTMVHDDRSMKPPPGRDANANESVNKDYLARRAPMIWNSTAFLKYFEDHARFPVVAAQLPRGRRAGVPTGGTFFILLASAPEDQKRAAWAFVRFMLETDQAIDWSTSTGYLPVTHGAVRRLEAEGFYRQHPNFRVAYDQLEVARPWPWSPELFRVQREILDPLIERAVLRRESPGRVMREAQKRALRAVRGRPTWDL
jgi:sn-glycerol 3-phosphate transport system substrate-binding protein